MNFSELKRICITNKISLSQVAESIDLSYDGLKKGINNESLSMRYVLPLCHAICITPNEFFGVETPSGDTNYGNMQKNAKKQIMQLAGTEELKATIEVLKEQLKIKDEQLAAKDRQINKLIGL